MQEKLILFKSRFLFHCHTFLHNTHAWTGLIFIYVQGEKLWFKKMGRWRVMGTQWGIIFDIYRSLHNIYRVNFVNICNLYFKEWRQTALVKFHILCLLHTAGRRKLTVRKYFNISAIVYWGVLHLIINLINMLNKVYLLKWSCWRNRSWIFPDFNGFSVRVVVWRNTEARKMEGENTWKLCHRHGQNS